MGSEGFGEGERLQGWLDGDLGQITDLQYKVRAEILNLRKDGGHSVLLWSAGGHAVSPKMTCQSELSAN